MWTCPDCGRRFANRNQVHSCGVYELEDHLKDASPGVRAIYDSFASAIDALGSVEILPEKTRIAFQVRMSFAAVTLKREHLDGHVVLARRVEDPRFLKIESLSPRNHVHHFRLTDVSEVDDQVKTWLAEAYSVGRQEHLRRGPQETS
jgi:hypothetical protein